MFRRRRKNIKIDPVFEAPELNKYKSMTLLKRIKEKSVFGCTDIES